MTGGEFENAELLVVSRGLNCALVQIGTIGRATMLNGPICVVKSTDFNEVDPDILSVVKQVPNLVMRKSICGKFWVCTAKKGAGERHFCCEISDFLFVAHHLALPDTER